MLQIAYVSKRSFSGEKTKYDVLLINVTVKISSEDRGYNSVAEHFFYYYICDFGFDSQDHTNRSHKKPS